MSSKPQSIKLSRLKVKLLGNKKPVIFALAFLVAGGIVLQFAVHAAGDSLSLLPNTSNVNIGSNLVVTIHENSGTDAVNAVEADLTYDQTKLQWVSNDSSTSAFDLQATSSGGNGVVTIARAKTNMTFTGDQIVAVVTFKALASGSTPVNFAASSALVRASDTTNVLSVTSGGTYTLADTTPPSIPTGLASPSQTVNSVSLTWAASTDNVGVISYKVLRGGMSVGTPATPSFTDTGLSPNTNYTYTLQALDAAGNISAQSATSTFMTAADTTPPSIPLGLTSPSQTFNTVSLSWSPSTDNVGVTNYKIYRGGVSVGNSPTNTFTDTGLAQNTSYVYTIAATDAAGNISGQSATSTFMTLADTTPPTVPLGLSSPSKTFNTVTINWSASNDNVAVAGYNIYRNGVAVGTSTSTSFTDTGLVQGVSYTYTVSAYDAAVPPNTSAQSTSISVTTMFKPGDCNGDGRVDITDFGILGSNYLKSGMTRAQCDLNGDGTVNVFDFSILAIYMNT